MHTRCLRLLAIACARSDVVKQLISWARPDSPLPSLPRVPTQEPLQQFTWAGSGQGRHQQVRFDNRRAAPALLPTPSYSTVPLRRKRLTGLRT